MNIVDRLSAALAVLMLLALLVIGVWVYIEREKKNAEVKKLESELVDCGKREASAALAVERQNAAVEAVRVDTVYVERIIKEAEKKYAEVRKEILLTVEKDSGCENKVDNIDYALRRFHGVGVHPAANGDKD